jgi:IS5 family transposase
MKPRFAPKSEPGERRYRGLAKNTAQLHILFAIANLVIVKTTLLAQAQA